MKTKRSAIYQSIPKYRIFIFTIIFALVAIFGLSLFTRNVKQSNIGTSQASAQEPADINNDNKVDVFDLSILLGKWNTADTTSDLNNDGTVDIFDLSRLLSKWGIVDGAGAATTYLPFDMPSAATLRQYNKRLFANYFIAHPISLDNEDPATDYWQSVYLNPQYSSGSSSSAPYWFAAHGGAYRDRPLGRPIINCTNDPAKPYTCWQLEDMKTEVRYAIAAGLDGFELNLLSSNITQDNWKRAVALIDAAIAVDPGFKIIITPDLNSTHWGNIDAAKMAEDLKYFMVNSDNTFKPCIYVNEYGKGVVSPFPTNKIQAGGERAISYWSDVSAQFSAITGGLELSWWAQLSDFTYAKGTTAFNNWTKPYTESPVFDAVTYWGTGKAKTDIVSSAKLRADIAHGLDAAVTSVDSEGNAKKWIQPLHVTDYRPMKHEDIDGPGKYDESKATEVLRNQWDATIRYADYAQFITWNDYSETAVSPSAGHGYGYLDLSSYYLVKFKTGSYPTIKRDAVYLTHRTHTAKATPACASYTSPKIPCTLLMESTDASIADYDNVESTVFLTAPATVEIKIGANTYNHNLPAGMSVVSNPLATGTVSARIMRGGTKVAGVTSPYIVTDSPPVQDMQYHIVSSLRNPN